MKTNFILILLVLIPMSLMFVGCEEDLELLPQDSLTPEAFYSNPENLPAALNGIYDGLQSRGMYNLMPVLDAITDNGIAQFVSVNDFVDFGLGNLTSSVNDIVIDYYQDPFIVIQRANILLANVEVDAGITVAERNAIEAEAKALRAIAYMKLVYLFGDIPLITAPLSREEILNVARTARAEVINFMIGELRVAGDALTTSPFNGERGRLTKQAVLGMRAKVLLYEARLGNRPWAEARAACLEAMDLAQNNGATLFTSGDGSNGQLNYEAIFFESNEDNAEILFSVKFDELDRGGDIFNRFGVQAGTLYMTVLENLVNDYYGMDGLPITDPNSAVDPARPYENRDPRLHASIIVPGALFSNGGSLEELTATSNPVAFTNFFLRKQITLEGDIELNDRGRLDGIVLRFADLLLMFAEAENELNGPTAQAYEAINRVRARVNMPQVMAGLSQAQFRSEVIHERRVELAFEEQRWFDLVTLGIANEQINGINEGFGRSFTPGKDELFPIPQTEINLNTNLTQNPGY